MYQQSLVETLLSTRMFDISAVHSRNLLSIPSKPVASTIPLTDRPKLSLVTAVAATAAKFWLPAPPPIDKINLRWLCLALRRRNDPIHPGAPSTTICAAAHSSFNYWHINKRPLSYMRKTDENTTIRLKVSKSVEYMADATIVHCGGCITSVYPPAGIVDRIFPHYIAARLNHFGFWIPRYRWGKSFVGRHIGWKQLTSVWWYFSPLQSGSNGRS